MFRPLLRIKLGSSVTFLIKVTYKYITHTVMNTIQYIDVMPQAMISVNDAILKAIERNYHTFVKAIHDEAKGYCFKDHNNKWNVAPFDFVNECAGLGFVNHCLLNY